MVTKIKPYNPSATELEADWHVLDADGKVLGRLASDAATLLMGKHRPGYVPHLLSGDFVIITNAAKVKVTGNKADQIVYKRHSQRPGKLKEIPYRQVQAKAPTRIIEHAVRGMLPKNKLGERMIRRLKVYVGEEHPHASQIAWTEARPEREAAAAAEAEEAAKKRAAARERAAAKKKIAEEAASKTAAAEAKAEAVEEVAEAVEETAAEEKAPAAKKPATRRKTTTKASTAKAPAKKATTKASTASAKTSASKATKATTTRKRASTSRKKADSDEKKPAASKAAAKPKTAAKKTTTRRKPAAAKKDE